LAGIVYRTDVAVTAGCRVVAVHAAAIRVAGVVSAWIVVGAVGLDSPRALARLTVLSDGTGIIIVARETFEGGLEGTLPGARVAVSLEAECAGALRFRAVHLASGHDCAQERQLVLVAVQRAVADVSIVDGETVVVDFALAVHRSPLALAICAEVPYGARLIVVARLGVGSEGALPLLACIIGAGIPVAADYRSRNAHSLLTVVAGCARIFIHALSAGERLTQASLTSLADVIRALVGIIAEADELPFNQVRLVDVVVAVIIQAVAGFRSCRWSVAIGQPSFGADPLALTGPPFVCDCARGGQTECNGMVGTFALPRVIDALGEQRPIQEFNLLTGETVRALAVLLAGTAAEAALARVDDAGILRTSGGNTVHVGSTRPAQIGEIRDTIVEQVRVGPRNLPAGPSRGARLLAQLRADAFAQVLHTPA